MTLFRMAGTSRGFSVVPALHIDLQFQFHFFHFKSMAPKTKSMAVFQTTAAS